MSKYPGTDNNMNSVEYMGVGGGMGYGGFYPSRMPPGGDIKKGVSMVSNSMCYREQPRPKSPSRLPPQTNNTLLDDFDHRPDSPPDAGGYDDDRIHNDLLEEICSDIGIRDTMDLDFLDFDGSEAFTKLPEDGDCFDQAIPFGQFPDHPEGYQQARAGFNQKLSVSVTGFDATKTGADSIASPTVSSTSPRLHVEAQRPSSIGSLGSPAVHSTTHAVPTTHQGAQPSPDDCSQPSAGLGSRASSLDSLVDSPATVIAACNSKDEPVPSPYTPVASPYTPSCQEIPSTDANKLKNLKEYGTIYGRGPPTPGSVVAQSPMKLKGYPNIKSEESAHNSSFDHHMGHVGHFKPVQSPSVGTTVSNASISTTMSQPSQASFSSGSIYSSVKHENTFKHPDKSRKDMLSSRSIESPFDLGYASMGSASVCTESQYGSQTSLDKMSTSSCGDMGSREKVMSYLHKSVPPNIPNFIPPIPISQSASAHIPGGSSPLADSPPQERVAKRARTINSGTDLLDCVREQYSFVKGADMYAKPRYPQVPVQRSRPTPYTHQGRPSCVQDRGLSHQNFQQSCQQQQQQQQQLQQQPYPGSNMGAAADRADMVSPNPLASAPVMTNSMSAGPGGCGGYGGPAVMNSSMSQPPMGGGMPQQTLYPQNTGGYPTENTNMGMMSNNSRGGSACNFTGRPGYDSRPPVARPRMAAQEMVGSMMQNRENMPQFNGGSMQGSMPYSQQHSQYNSGGQYHSSNGANQLRHKVAGMSNQNCYNGNQWQQQQQQQSLDGSMHSAISQQQQQQQQQQRPMDGMAPRQQYPMGQQQQYNQQMNMQQQQRPPMRHPQQQQQQQQQQQILPQNHGQMSTNSACPPQPQPMVPNHQQMNIPGLPNVNPGTPMTPQHGLMHHIITDKSNSFRSHPLFPLLRDLIIADMNFHSPSFPFQLIANLPADFDKLLQNYMNRNPNSNFQGNDAVNGVLMDALKYAHRAIIEKIKVKKQQEGYKEPPRPLSAIEDFCERFDKAVRNSMDKPEDNPLKHHPAASSSSLLASKALSASMPLHPLKSSSPAPDHMPPQQQQHQQHPQAPSHGSSSLPCTPSKSHKVKVESDASKAGTGTQNGTGGGKNKVLPKEAVAVMLSWLREHQDNPYPNDDEKEMLINKTKLTINQINYWFTNARRRILPKWALQRYMEQQQQQHQYATQMHMLGAPH